MLAEAPTASTTTPTGSRTPQRGAPVASVLAFADRDPATSPADRLALHRLLDRFAR